MRFTFSKHLIDAIIINSKRLPLYAWQSGGTSIPVSLVIIISEVFSLPVSLYYDIKALKYQKRGIPFIAQELIDMKHVPQAQAKSHFKPAQIPSFKVDHKLIQTSLNHHDALTTAVEKEFNRIPHGYYPMIHHILESMLRGLDAHHNYRQSYSDDEKLLSLSDGYIKSHLMAFPLAKVIDAMANWHIKRGITIIAGDVPAIARLERK